VARRVDEPRALSIMVTICRLYDSYADADRVIPTLNIAGVLPSETSVISNHSDRWYRAPKTARVDPVRRDDATGAATGKIEGAAVGAAIGAPFSSQSPSSASSYSWASRHTTPNASSRCIWSQTPPKSRARWPCSARWRSISSSSIFL
jgi:hypothetical protein